MGTCAVKEMKLSGSTITNSKEECEIIMSDLNLATSSENNKNLNFIQQHNRSKRVLTQILMRQQNHDSDLDLKANDKIDIPVTNDKISSQQTLSTSSIQNENKQQNSTVISNMSLKTQNSFQNNLCKNTVCEKTTSQIKSKSKKNLITNQSLFKRKSSTNSKFSLTVVNTKKQKQSLSFHSQSLYAFDLPQCKSNLLQSISKQNKLQSSLNDSSLEDILSKLRNQNIEEGTIKLVCDSHLQNKAKELGQVSQEFYQEVKQLAISLFKQQFHELGRYYLDLLVNQKTSHSKEQLMKNLTKYQSKRE